jgi:hypothetical protein
MYTLQCPFLSSPVAHSDNLLMLSSWILLYQIPFFQNFIYFPHFFQDTFFRDRVHER